MLWMNNKGVSEQNMYRKFEIQCRRSMSTAKHKLTKIYRSKLPALQFQTYPTLSAQKLLCCLAVSVEMVVLCIQYNTILKKVLHLYIGPGDAV